MLLQQESHDRSHDFDDVPLAGIKCVQVLHYVPRGALHAYSAFIAVLLESELEGVSRGVVYSAMKRATVMSSQEAGLWNRVQSLRKQDFSHTELGSGYMKCKTIA
jgi:hypothetical protein